MKKVPSNMSNAEKAEYYKNRKKLHLQQQKLNCYHRHAEDYNNNKKEKRAAHLREDKTLSKSAVYKQKKRLEQKRKLEIQRIKKQEYRARKKRERNDASIVNDNDETLNINRMTKSRAIKKLKNALPSTPIKRVAILKHYLSSGSPTATTIKKQNTEECSLIEDVFQNIRTFVKETKNKRNTDSRNAMNIISASVSGENLCKSKTKVAKKLGLQPRRLSGGERIRTRVLNSESSCFDFTKRRTRSDATSEDTKKLAYEFWISPEISRTTGNKADIKRMRTGPKEYVSHAIHILEKTQTEAFLDFKNKYPDIHIGQRLFESYKPFFVLPVRPKDRNTCCCRQHVETKLVFKKCMEFRKSLLKSNLQIDKTNFPIYEHLSEMSDETLCNKSKPKAECLNRKCSDCGVSKLFFLNEELDKSENARDITWERYEYVKLNAKGGKIINKIQLVKKVSKPGFMFEYLIKLLETFPAHQTRANWQNKQYRNLTETLPFGHAVCLHDFSENYKCSDRTEIQSSYFQKTEVSIHVTILHRHAILELDGEDSTPETTVVVAEQFFVISADLQHDRYFTQHCQNVISYYLKSISADIKIMHEFTDGCSSQYKSRNCMGDVSNSSDLGYKVIRNYFETSHAKGPQDAAGGFLENQADYAVLRRKTSIQNAKDLYSFAKENLQVPKSKTANYKRRLYRYVESIPREHNRNYKPINQNRKVHQIISENGSGSLTIRDLSCYECEKCVEGEVTECSNSVYIGGYRPFIMNLTSAEDQTEDETECQETCDTMSHLISKNSVVAVLADDPDYEYFLIKVTQKPKVIEKEISDAWGCSFQPGTEVIKGYYYDRISSTPFLYKLIPRKMAICHVVAVKYICIEIDCDDNISIPEELHLDIIESLK